MTASLEHAGEYDIVVLADGRKLTASSFWPSIKERNAMRARKGKTIKISQPGMVRTAMRDTAIIRVEAPLIILDPPESIKKRKKGKR